MVKKCLAKDRDERWQSASDLTSELNWITEGGSQAGVPRSGVSKREHRVAWVNHGRRGWHNMDINNTYQLNSLASRIRGMPHALTADELAEMLNMSRITILRRAKRGKIPSFRIDSFPARA